jgi:hypothetical protein
VINGDGEPHGAALAVRCAKFVLVGVLTVGAGLFLGAGLGELSTSGTSQQPVAEHGHASVIPGSSPAPSSPSSSQPAPTVSSPRTSATKAKPLQPEAVIRRLQDARHPFTIAVLGDSAGAVDDSWVRQLGRSLGERYHRTVIEQPWSVGLQPNAYGNSYVLSYAGPNPITIWNGSAFNENATYSLAHLPTLLPMSPNSIDVVIISHGLGEPAAELATDGGHLLDAVAGRESKAAVIVVAENPVNAAVVGPGMAAVQDENVAQWTAVARSRGYAVADVYSAFRGRPDLSALLDNSGNLPTAMGSSLWAETVQSLLAPSGAAR